MLSSKAFISLCAFERLKAVAFKQDKYAHQWHRRQSPQGQVVYVVNKARAEDNSSRTSTQMDKQATSQIKPAFCRSHTVDVYIKLNLPSSYELV